MVLHRVADDLWVVDILSGVEYIAQPSLKSQEN